VKALPIQPLLVLLVQRMTRGSQVAIDCLLAMHWLSTSLMLICEIDIFLTVCLVVYWRWVYEVSITPGMVTLVTCTAVRSYLKLISPLCLCHVVRKTGWTLPVAHTGAYPKTWILNVIAYQNVIVLARIVFPHVPHSCYGLCLMGFWFVMCLQRVKVIQMQKAKFVLLLFSYYSYSCA
jgi:hypothetical protein